MSWDSANINRTRRLIIKKLIFMFLNILNIDGYVIRLEYHIIVHAASKLFLCFLADKVLNNPTYGVGVGGLAVYKLDFISI